MLEELHSIDPAVRDLPVLPFLPEIDEHAAREALRRQIARLERDLAQALAELRPGDEQTQVRALRPRLRGPRLLSLGELERVRDAQAARLVDMRAEIAERADREAGQRVLLEKMLLEPGRYRYVRITQADLGERGCGAYHVRPRLGIIGMLAGWWHVKVS